MQLASRLDAKQARIESATRSLRSKAEDIAIFKLFTTKCMHACTRRESCGCPRGLGTADCRNYRANGRWGVFTLRGQERGQPFEYVVDESDAGGCI